MQPHIISIKDTEDDREGPKVPIVGGQTGRIVLSPFDAAMLLDFIHRIPHREAWMLDVLTHGSKM